VLVAVALGALCKLDVVWAIANVAMGWGDCAFSGVAFAAAAWAAVSGLGMTGVTVPASLVNATFTFCGVVTVGFVTGAGTRDGQLIAGKTGVAFGPHTNWLFLKYGPSLGVRLEYPASTIGFKTLLSGVVTQAGTPICVSSCSSGSSCVGTRYVVVVPPRELVVLDILTA
jgi:hypothetical protein